jgi:hypothetical protein
MLRQALRRCSYLTPTTTTMSVACSSGMVTTSQRHHIRFVHSEDGAHRQFLTPRRRGQGWSSASPLGARGKKTAAAAAASSSSASPSSSSSAAGVKRRSGKGKKSVASPPATAAGEKTEKTEEADCCCCCDGYGWVLLGCDSDAGGALAVVRGPSVGVIAAVDVLDAPTMKVEVNGKPRTRLCVEQMVQLVAGLGCSLQVESS